MSDAPSPVNGEFTFHVTERTDRNGVPYLFAGIQLLNVVLFLFPEPQAPGEPRRWKGVVRPYQGGQGRAVDAGAWNDTKDK